MAEPQPAHSALVGRAALKLAQLPGEDLLLVLEFIDQLARQHSPPPAVLSVTEIRKRAKELSKQLVDVPREQLMARFLELGEEIRQEAIAKGTAVEGDWTGD